MLTGKQLGAAIAEAIQKKRVKKADVARHFNVSPPSVQGWCDTGRIGKERLPELWDYFSDVVGPAHWGLRQDDADAAHAQPKPSNFLRRLSEFQKEYETLPASERELVDEALKQQAELRRLLKGGDERA